MSVTAHCGPAVTTHRLAAGRFLAAHLPEDSLERPLMVSIGVLVLTGNPLTLFKRDNRAAIGYALAKERT